jgi:hypothetical protein
MSVGKPESLLPLVRPRSRWEDDIEIELKEKGVTVWIGFIWLRK